MGAPAAVSDRGVFGVEVHRPRTVDEALHLRSQLPDAPYVAGGTWVLRAAQRGEDLPAHAILLNGVAGLDHASIDGTCELGALVTFARIASVTRGQADLQALTEASSLAATPALRRMITLGGSLAADAFWASDIVPALLCLDAEIVWQGDLITGVRIARTGNVSCHERLTWRSGGEYSVATVSMTRAGDELRIAIGSVEAHPRRWTDLEEAAAGGPLTPAHLRDLARSLVVRLDAVSAPGIPADYRRTVLPEVVARAMARIA
jgi:carbon-monoxide dehydrogenase medium subunit